jgi:hypothetical protein
LLSELFFDAEVALFEVFACTVLALEEGFPVSFDFDDFDVSCETVVAFRRLFVD